jgi:parvulin-like peptidyl-prolyl isomerase
MAEYRLALRNPRLGNKLRAEAAVLLADLEVRDRGDVDSALSLLTEAKRLSFRTAEQLEVPARIQALQNRSGSRARNTERSAQSSTYGEGLLVQQSVEETSGPVLATLPSGRKVQMGQLVTQLRRAGTLNSPELRSAPNLLEQAAAELLEEELAIDRAIAKGDHLDPAIQDQLWLLYRSIVRSRGESMATVRASDEETSVAAAALYQARINDYIRPGNMGLSAIFTATSESAAVARRELHDGRSFDAVATSHSLDRETATKGGFLGLISDSQTTLPVLGEQPELLTKLRTLPLLAISAPTQVGDKWAIFRINSRQPGVHISLDEARPRLLAEIARQPPARSKARRIQDIESEVEVDQRLLGQFFRILDGKTLTPVSSSPPGPDVVE